MVAAAGFAQAVDTSFTYQGVLQDGGVPASGQYDIQFRLFDTAVGGSPIASDFKNNVQVVDGRFTADLDFGETAFNNGGDRWVQIEVRPGASGGAFTTLTPRQPVNPSPYAMNSGRLTGFNPAPNDANLAAETRDWFGAGGALRTYEETGSVYGRIEPDIGGTGGFFEMHGDVGTFVIDGNTGTGTGPIVSIGGPSSSSFFDTNSSGNASVGLPISAVSSSEMFNEPGVAGNVTGSSVSITSTTLTTIQARTISCPSSGYVIVLGDLEVDFDHAFGTVSSYIFGVSDSSTTLPASQDVNVYLDSTVSSGTRLFGQSSHAVFPVTAGNNTFYLLGRKLSSGSPNLTTWESKITCLFVPTAYGAVTGALPPAVLAGDSPEANPGLPVVSFGMGEAEIAAEREQSILDHQARMQAEMDAMRDEMELMRAMMDDNRPAAKPAQGDLGE